MSAPIVLYGAHALAGFKRGAPTMSRPAKRARLGFQIARHMYRNRGKYYRAARVIGRAWRRHRRSAKTIARLTYASPGSTARAKSTEQLIDVSMDTFTQYTALIDLPNEGTSPNERLRNAIRLSGFKLCFDAENKSTSNSLYFNLAVVQERSAPASKTAVGTTRFFKSYGSNYGRDFPISTAIENHCCPINTEEYRVFMHKRFVLSEKDTGGGSNKHLKRIMRYVPLKKFVKFDSSNFSNGQLRCVFWCQRAGALSIPVETGLGRMTGALYCYFREPRH